MATLPRRFFEGPAPAVARAFLGHLLVHETPEGRTVGRIVETEAYDQTDAASHSHRGLTPRNQAMFGKGGVSYVYRSYGMHWCMNVSCGPEGFGAAALFRALEPTEGLELMAHRRGLFVPYKEATLCRGPGNLTRAMGILGAHDQMDLLKGELRIEKGQPVPDSDVCITKRIGITKAAEVPWRFCIANHPCVSGPKSWRSSG